MAPKKQDGETKKKEGVAKKQGRNALKEMRKYQATNRFLIPKKKFSALARSVLASITEKDDLRFEPDALLALQAASEQEAVDILDIANRICLRRRGQEMNSRDWELAKYVTKKK